MYIVTTKQMQEIEKSANDSGLDYDEMMENAGAAVAEAINMNFNLGGINILVLVGPGNNGGDGLVTARHLDQTRANVTVYVWKRQLENDKNWALLADTDVRTVVRSEKDHILYFGELLVKADIIVDALLGTGVSRPIEGFLASLLLQVKFAVNFRRNLSMEGFLTSPTLPVKADYVRDNVVIVAIDVPTGLNSDTGAVDLSTVPADITVSLSAVKMGHILMPGLEIVGRLIIADIGIEAEHYPDDVNLEMAVSLKVLNMLPSRPAGAHKGSFGTALLVAGSINYTGAAILAGHTASSIGSGMVAIAPPRSIHPILAANLMEAIYFPMPEVEGVIAPEAVPLLRERIQQADALLIGPGLGQAMPTATFLLELLNDNNNRLPPLVLDADALNILAQQDEWWRLLPAGSILTPHPGEMSRLTGKTVEEIQDSRLDIVAEMASKWNQIVLLKGAYTVIAAPGGRIMVMPFANPALAKAGSGDVLAGAIVGLLAQGMFAFEAAVAGAYLHGLAGELAREDLGAASVTAGDLISFLPLAMQTVNNSHQQVSP